MKKKVQAIFLKIQRWSSFSPKNCAQIDQKSFLDRAPRMEQQLFLSICFVVEIHRPNAMVGDDDDQPEVSLLFILGCSTYRT
jgi:hypothetical protein